MTDQELIILTVLSETERYGYEIDKIIKSRQLHSGNNIALSSIYAVLTRLFRQGLLTSRETARSGKPPRKLYGISPNGLTVLESALTKALLSKDRILGKFELIVTVWPILSNDRRKELLTAYLNHLNEKFVRFEGLVRQEINPISAAYFERPMAAIKAEIEWLKHFSSRNGIEIANSNAI